MIVRHGRRILAFLSLLVFLTGTSGDLLSRHLCPHHDADVLAAATPGSHHAHQDPAPDQKDHDGCTCVGRCVQNSAAPLPAIAHALVLAAPVQTVATTFRARAHAHVQPRHFLPFANAPPVIA